MTKRNDVQGVTTEPIVYNRDNHTKTFENRCCNSCTAYSQTNPLTMQARNQKKSNTNLRSMTTYYTFRFVLHTQY